MARSDPAAGGLKKVLYTVAKLRAIGLGPASKALRSNNACKACGLGMGGQRGGMTNELGDFPAVCNKSVQAQSTDIAPPIPDAVFAHTLTDLQALDERELASLGRLNTPLLKPPGSDGFRQVTWDDALSLAARRFAATRAERSFFYSSGRSSNEAGFLLQLIARLYGTNNVNNCSYYCHQATGEGLANAIGTGTATVELADLTRCDLVFLIGANPASNHPRLLHMLQGVRERGGQIVVINPARERGLVRFAVPKSPRSLAAGGTWIANHYLQPNIGTDALLLQGIAKALVATDTVDHDFIGRHTVGAANYQAQLRNLAWPEIERITGVARTEIESVARSYSQSRAAVFAWGMGVTHHLNGVDNVEEIANLAFLRGMIGRPGAGLLPLRGHSNVQGIGTIGVKPVLPETVFERLEESLGVTLPRQPGLDTMAAMQAAMRGDIDAALLMGGNLYGSNPSSAWAEKALNNIGFKLYLTTTLNRGHVCGVEDGETLILPVAARDEEREPTTQESMFNYVRLSDGGIQRLNNVRPESDVLSEFGARLLPDAPLNLRRFAGHRTLRQTIAEVVPGMEELASIDIAKREFHVRNRLLHTPEFKTPNGKARFHCNPYKTPEPDLDFPFTLTTVRSEGQFNTIVYEEEDSYRDTTTRWCVMLGPEDMSRLKLRRGSRVTLRSAQGVMVGVQVVQHDLPPGNAMAYFPEANVLTSTKVDPRSRTPAFKATPIQITPLLAVPARSRPKTPRD